MYIGHSQLTGVIAQVDVDLFRGIGLGIDDDDVGIHFETWTGCGPMKYQKILRMETK